MQYDFTTHVDRSGSGSAKWNEMLKANPSVAQGIVPLSVADMELPNPPEIIDAVVDYAQNHVLGYTDPTPEFLDACCSWQRRRHGWQAEPNWLCISPGVVPALYACVRAYSEPGDAVIIQPPVYYPFRMSVEASGRTLLTNPLRITEADDGSHRYEMDFEDLARKAADPSTKLLILCSPHNPVGRVWSPEELRRLLDICVANDVIVIADEIHDDLIMEDYSHTAIMSVAETGELDHIVVCTAPSKTFNIAGLQCSTIFVPDDELRDKFKRALTSIGIGELNALAYPAATAAYTRCDAWLDQLIELIGHNYQLLKGLLGAYLPELEVYPLEGSYLAWVDMRAWGLDAAELEQFMNQDAQVFCDQGSLFGAEGAGFERFNLACPTDVLENALERLVHAVSERGLGGREPRS